MVTLCLLSIDTRMNGFYKLSEFLFVTGCCKQRNKIGNLCQPGGESVH